MTFPIYLGQALLAATDFNVAAMMFSTGVLTYDGVHANANGNGLLADHISRGIYDALNKLRNR
jgi:hypothetical protein